MAQDIKRLQKAEDAIWNLQMAENAIVDLVNERPVYGGAGRGQTATAAGVTARGTSRVLAAEALLALLQAKWEETRAGDDEWVEQQAPPKRVRVRKPRKDGEPVRTAEGVLADLQSLFSGIEYRVPGEDERPAPLWSDDGLSLIAVIPCVPECMDGKSDICDCRCQGANHGISSATFLENWGAVTSVEEAVVLLHAIRPVVLGAKECACGCGTETARRFAPGHDARYHGRILREAQAAERGITPDEVPAALRRERAARRRAAAKAALDAAKAAVA